MTYSALFFGLLMFIDINIAGFDILPDFIGWILLIVGFGNLQERSTYFSRGKDCSTILLILHVLSVLVGPSYHDTMLNLLYTAGGLAMTLLTVVTVHALCMGISDDALAAGNIDLSNRADSRFKLYLIVTMLAWMVGVLPIFAFVAAIPLFIGFIVAYGAIITLVKNAWDMEQGKRLAGEA